MVYVDTSAMFALLDQDDVQHIQAVKIWKKLLSQEQPPGLFISDYTLVELITLIQHRLGMQAVKSFHQDIYPLLSVEWCTESIFRQAMSALAAAGRKTLSFVDCASFEVMHYLGIRQVFTFDKHFREQGFYIVSVK